MANIEEVSGVYGGVKTDINDNVEAGVIENSITGTNLPAKTGFWNKVKAVMFYDLKIELTPYQQKIEDEINEFLHQEITWEKVHDFLFQEIRFGKKKEQA